MVQEYAIGHRKCNFKPARLRFSYLATYVVIPIDQGRDVEGRGESLYLLL